MSMLNRPVNGGDLGEVIASTRDYEAAQKTVSKLIAGEVPARDIAIVGEGVRTVERVTGKLGYAAAARSGATNGVLIGLVLSAIMLFGNPEAPITLFLGFILVGVALGMIMSLITYAIVRRRRDFASVSQMLADHYEVRVQSASLAKARSVMGAERPATTRPAVDLSEPPRYGERVTPGSAGAAAGSAGAAGSSAAAGAAHAGAPHTAAAPPPPPPLPPVAAAPEVPDTSDGGASDAGAVSEAGTSDAAAEAAPDAAGQAPVGGDAQGDGHGDSQSEAQSDGQSDGQGDTQGNVQGDIQRDGESGGQEPTASSR